MTDEIKRGRLFVGCIFSLVATAFGFVLRGDLLATWQAEFGLSEEQKGIIIGAGLFPFAISIILFSLIVDRIGYGTAMVFAFLGHVISAGLTLGAGFIVDPNDPGSYKVAYQLLYTGTLIYALANGIVEAVINPVTATLYPEKKTHYLNILHAGWPLGLVLTALLTFGAGYLGRADHEVMDSLPLGMKLWQWKMALVLLPTLLYGVLLFRQSFPVQERVSAGVSYREMMQEFGSASAFIVTFLLGLGIFQILGVFEIEAPNPETAHLFPIAISVAAGAIMSMLFTVLYGDKAPFLTIVSFILFLVGTVAVVGATLNLCNVEFASEYVSKAKLGEMSEHLSSPENLVLAASGALLIISLLLAMAFKCFGRAIFVFLLLVMFMLATTELGTDGWITDIMKGVLADTKIGPNAGVLVLGYTSLIMFILRFFAGPIVHKISPLGLLAVSAALACGGLVFLANAGTTLWMVLIAATIYGVGKTFFWPTTLGVVSEQTPKGGALTLNAIAGVGMIAVGVLGGPLMGAFQDRDVEPEVKSITGLKATTTVKTAIGLPLDSDAKEVGGDQLLKEAKTGLFFDSRSLDTQRLSDLKEALEEEVKKAKANNDAVAQKEAEDQLAFVSSVETKRNEVRQKFLMKVAVLPGAMFACYVLLILLFRMRGGYEEEKIGGGIETREEHERQGGDLV